MLRLTQKRVVVFERKSRQVPAPPRLLHSGQSCSPAKLHNSPCLHLIPLTVLSRWLGEQREALHLATRVQLLGRNSKRSEERLEDLESTVVDASIGLTNELEESVDPLGIIHLTVMVTGDQEAMAELVNAEDNLAQQTPLARGDEKGAPCLVLDFCGLLNEAGQGRMKLLQGIMSCKARKSRVIHHSRGLSLP